MASIFSHALVAVVLGKAYARKPMPPRFWFWAMAAAVLPDADVIGFAFGIKYREMLGHRGLSHSLLFALVVGVLIALLAFRMEIKSTKQGWHLSLFFFATTASHAVLDALTNGGLGVAFFAPFDNARYFFPWRPIQVSPIGVDAFFSEWGLRVILSELLWVGVPALMLWGLIWLYQTRRLNE